MVAYGLGVKVYWNEETGKISQFGAGLLIDPGAKSRPQPHGGVVLEKEGTHE
jgi:hypothetical protein